MTDTPVRLALPSDEDQIMDLLDLMHGEEAFEPVDGGKVRITLRLLLVQQGGIVGVIRNNGRIEGTVGLRLESLWYSTARHLDKLWLYVHQDCRKSTHAKSMLEFAKWYSDQVGIPLIAEEILAPQTEARLKLVGRQLTDSGRVFLHNRRDLTSVAAAVA